MLQRGRRHRAMDGENALKANPLDVHQQYEKQLRDLQEANGEAMQELRARIKLQALMEREDDSWNGSFMRAFSTTGSWSP
ncbi:MAG: hypothetical protein AAGF94_08435 [Pseudomonadota bacterium]